MGDDHVPLPELIEIVPLDKPVRAEITVPGSKSITNRALILGALAEGETTLSGALWSEDTQVMTECLQDLGFMANVAPDPEELCNRTITVYGKGGEVPRGGTDERPLELFVGNAGTAARFLTAFVCLGKGVYRLHGTPRMHERPQAELFTALRQLGYEVEPEKNDERLPVRITGGSPSAGVQPRIHAQTGEFVGAGSASCSVSINSSSQFASALLLCARAGGWNVKVLGENAEESPYVRMTSEISKVFPRHGGRFQIEPDASSGSYFLAVNKVGPSRTKDNQILPRERRTQIAIRNWPGSGWQVDDRFLEVLQEKSHEYLERVMEAHEQTPEITDRPEFWTELRRTSPTTSISRSRDLGDSIMTAIVCAPVSPWPLKFVDLARLRLQECERVTALRTELTKCGAEVVEEDDTLTVFPSKLHGAEIETYNDHRMAMCFSILGLKVPGIKIKNPACVKKTFPNFFQKMSAPPPKGLGAIIRDGRTGQALGLEDLFAE